MSITDGSFVCGLCGEWMTGCSLCGVAPLVDRQKEIALQLQGERDAENELRRQEHSIRDAAQKRI